MTLIKLGSALVVALSLVACTVAPPSPAPSEDKAETDESTAQETKGKSDGTTSSSKASSSSSSSSGSTAASDAGTTAPAASCTDLNGSCRTATVCNEYRGGSADIQKKTCDGLKGTWSDGPCDLTDAVAGCKVESNVQSYCSSGTSWMFAPLTEDDVKTGCPTGVIVHPDDAEE